MSGGREIRTLGPVSQTLVFKTSAIDHSAIPPYVVATVTYYQKFYFFK